MNVYGRLADFKAQAGGITDRANDLEWVRLLEVTSRSIDAYLDRRVYARTATRYLDGDIRRLMGERLLLPEDLQAITTLKTDANADDTYETTWSASDYYLYPNDGPPYWAIDVRPSSTKGWTYGRRTVELVGTWGYSLETESTGLTVQNTTQIDASGTSLTVQSNGTVDIGATLLIESEQLSVTSRTGDTTLIVSRAYNGTTAAAHVTGTAISRYRYPRAIEQACIMQALRWAWEAQGGYQGNILATESGSRSSLYPMIRDVLAQHRRVVLV